MKSSSSALWGPSSSLLDLPRDFDREALRDLERDRFGDPDLGFGDLERERFPSADLDLDFAFSCGAGRPVAPMSTRHADTSATLCANRNGAVTARPCT